MHYVFTFKRGPEIVAELKGRDIGSQTVTETLGQDVIALEQKLERMLGTRIHISLRYDEGDNRIEELNETL